MKIKKNKQKRVSKSRIVRVKKQKYQVWLLLASVIALAIAGGVIRFFLLKRDINFFLCVLGLACLLTGIILLYYVCRR